MNFPLVRAEINLSAIAHNVCELRRITHPNALLMAVVKANAYGHGSVQIAFEALQNGAQFLGVARIDEAILLRNAGIEVPILILGYTPPELVQNLIEFNLTQTVYSVQTAQAYSAIATHQGKSVKIHLKIDTGMGRLGIWITAAVREIDSIMRLQGLELEGIYTHFAASDSSNKSYSRYQLEQFMDLLNTLRRCGILFPLRHAANSGAIIDMPEAHLDMVRAGISLYGLYPSDEVNKSRIRLIQAMELKATVIHLKDVPGGFNVSYGMTYQTQTPTRIATVSIGYADGLNRLLSSKGRMIVCGKIAPIIGRVCMDLTMLDVGHIPDVCIGDEVIVFGKQGESIITIDEIASSLNTINYEVVSLITGRVIRCYLR